MNETKKKNKTILVNEEFHPAKSGYLRHVIAVIYACA